MYWALTVLAVLMSQVAHLISVGPWSMADPWWRSTLGSTSSNGPILFPHLWCRCNIIGLPHKPVTCTLYTRVFKGPVSPGNLPAPHRHKSVLPFTKEWTWESDKYQDSPQMLLWYLIKRKWQSVCLKHVRKGKTDSWATMSLISYADQSFQLQSWEEDWNHSFKMLHVAPLFLFYLSSLRKKAGNANMSTQEYKMSSAIMHASCTPV